MNEHGFEPSEPALPHMLLRRLYFDLTGLPPAPEEVEAFAGESSQEAYVRIVDCLLASPAYGEKWGREWLDIARYADTNGYEKDRPRSMWPYRDWVIRSLNADMPFDQFTIEQLAGDMLPGRLKINALQPASIGTRNSMKRVASIPLSFVFTPPLIAWPPQARPGWG